MMLFSAIILILSIKINLGTENSGTVSYQLDNPTGPTTTFTHVNGW